MLIVTDRAKEKLVALKTSVQADGPEVGLRLESQTRAGEFALFPDEARPGDHVVEHAGSKVLLIGEDLAQALTAATIDCEAVGENDAHLVIKRSQHKGSR